MSEKNSIVSVLSALPSWFSPALVVLLLSVIVLLPASPVLYYTPDTDSSIFMLIGEKILAGDLPFRDWYDHKPPLIFYLNALGLWLGQGSRWGIWALELTAVSSAGLFAFAFLRRYYGAWIAVLSVSAMLLNLAFVHERGNLTEEYALPFQFAAIFLVSQAARSKRMGLYSFLIGASLAMASSLKQPLAGVGVAVAVYLAIEYAHQNRWLDLLRTYALLALGFVTVWAAWFLYFALAGIFPEFWEAAFAYNFALAGIPLVRRLQALFSALDFLFGMSGFFLAGMLAWLALFPYLLSRDDRLMATLLNRRVGLLLAVIGGILTSLGLLSQPLLTVAGLPLIVIGLLSATGLAQKWLAPWGSASGQERTSPLFVPMVIALVDLPVALVFTALSGNNYGHYFMALLPSLTLLTAFLIHAILGLFNSETGRPLRYAWLLVFLLPVIVPGLVHTEEKIGPRGDRQVEDVVTYVMDHTNPDDYVYQWGVVPQVNLLTGRDAPSRYFFADPLFVEGYSGEEQSGELLRDLRANPPVLIVDQRIPRLPLLRPAEGQACEAVMDPQLYAQYLEEWRRRIPYGIPDMPGGMPEVYYWICQNYTQVGSLGELEWPVYRLKGK